KPAAGTSPAVRWVGWDALLSRSGEPGVGSLVELAPGADASRMGWRAHNCVYAGWGELLSGGDGARGLAEWRRRWGQPEGEAASAETWPSRPYADPETRPAAAFLPTDRVADRAVTYAGTADPSQPLGAPGAELPPTHDGWPAFDSERFDLVRPEP